MRSGVRIGCLLFFDLLLLVLQTDAAKETKGDGCTYNTQNAKRIGTSIAVGNSRSTCSEDLIAGFRSGTKAWGVRDGSTKHTHHHGKLA